MRPAKEISPRPQAKARPRQLPHVLRGPTERPKRSLDKTTKIVLELFSGKGELSRALRREGLTVVAFEILVGAEFGLSRRTTQLAFLSLIRVGLVECVHLGFPCTVWSTWTRPASKRKSA